MRADDQTMFDRVQAAADRGMGLLIRQSSLTQKQNHQASHLVQRDQARYLAALGLPTEHLRVIDARGESGRAGARRELFWQLLADVRAGKVGLLLLARHDRLGRNDADSAALFDALRDTGGFIMVDGRLYDPSEPHDDLMLGLQAKFAEYENKARMRWMQAARWALVCRNQYRVRLPSGLVWASPFDTDYRARLDAADLSYWVERLLAQPSLYVVRSRQNVIVHTLAADLNATHVAALESGRRLLRGGDGTMPDASDDVVHGDDFDDALTADGRGRRWVWVYPLPFPDKEVFRSVELRLQWLRETESVSEVYARMKRHRDWPRPGLLPVTASSMYRPGMQAEWRRGSLGALRQWFLCPALYGTYLGTSRVVGDVFARAGAAGDDSSHDEGAVVGSGGDRQEHAGGGTRHRKGSHGRVRSAASRAGAI